MLDIHPLQQYLNQLLSCHQFKDYGPNGLQLEGSRPVRRLVTGVTASLAQIDAAIDADADLLLVHHGLFWNGDNPCLVGWRKKRIERLLQQGMHLLAYHLPLDAHPLYGNNVQLAQHLDLTPLNAESLGPSNLILLAELDAPCSAQDFAQRLQQRLQRPPLHLPGNNQPIQRIALCTGAAQKFFEQAAGLGIDAYLSGEVSENTTHLAAELGIHYYGLGHHASERYGVQALGEHLSQTFGLEHRYIEIENPV